MKMPDTINEISRITIPGKTGELTGDSFMHNFSMRSPVVVVKIDIDSFAINIKNSEKPSTNANLALFFSIRINELSADEQKLSQEIAR
jgi:hypothetical protein